MTEKRYKSISTNLKYSNGMEYMLIKREDGFNVCQVCSKYTANEIVNELNALDEENKNHKQRISMLSELLDLADAIIDFSDDEKAKEVWENKNEEFEKKWEDMND